MKLEARKKRAPARHPTRCASGPGQPGERVNLRISEQADVATIHKFAPSPRSIAACALPAHVATSRTVASMHVVQTGPRLREVWNG
jgi:hypothetical protein